LDAKAARAVPDGGSIPILLKIVKFGRVRFNSRGISIDPTDRISTDAEMSPRDRLLFVHRQIEAQTFRAHEISNLPRAAARCSMTGKSFAVNTPFRAIVDAQAKSHFPCASFACTVTPDWAIPSSTAVSDFSAICAQPARANFTKQRSRNNGHY
jgi:hypothetical protein